MQSGGIVTYRVPSVVFTGALTRAGAGLAPLRIAHGQEVPWGKAFCRGIPWTQACCGGNAHSNEECDDALHVGGNGWVKKGS
jgi:hypothetical protein